MLYTDLTKKALKICYDAHNGSVDKGGIPYVFHPFHIAEQLREEDEVCLALLHDVVEDSDYTIEDIRKEGFPENVIEALSKITHNKSQTYEEYIDIVKTNKLATRIKLIDLEHNCDVSRLNKIDEISQRRLIRYEAAKIKLTTD